MKKSGVSQIVHLMFIALIGAIVLPSCAATPQGEGFDRNTITAAGLQTAATGNFNYGEALQKAIMFYEFQRSGKIPANSRNNWRGDSGMNDGADNGVDLTGGWYDAGDHVKFNLPMAYSVAMLSWSVYESQAAYQNSGQLPYILDNIKWAADYLIKCHTGPNEFYYQVGAGGTDHSWWGPAEVMQMARPSYKVTMSSPGSTVVGEAAAALAAASIVFKNSDPSYSATLLLHAKGLYSFAETTKSDAGYSAASGFYNSWSGFYDELSWAGVWLYLATSDNAYLNKAEAYVTNWGKDPQTGAIEHKWAHCWDDVHYGTEILLARITGKPLYKSLFEKHMDFWTIGYQGSKIRYTPKGLAWLDTWGSLRYATTEAFLASVYANWVDADASKAAAYRSFAKTQVDYALGSTGRSYVVGYGVNPPKHPHHRTAHGSWSDSMSTPAFHRHTIYGALVGGPGSDDSYTDDINNYTVNEIACDYNAGFVCALAIMYDQFGGSPIPDFNAFETPSNDEFFVEAVRNASGLNFIEIKALMNNKSGWPARMGNKLSFRYFIDISEFIAKGYNPGDFTITANYNQGGAIVSSSLKPWDTARNIYYALVDFSSSKIYPGGQSAYKSEIQFRIAAPQNANYWDNLNDWSYLGDTANHGGAPSQNINIPVYENGSLIYGAEPGGSSSSYSSSSKMSSSSSLSSRSSIKSSSSSIISSSSSSKSSIKSSSSTSSSVSKSSISSWSSFSSSSSSSISSIASSKSSVSSTSSKGAIKVMFFNGNSADPNNTIFLRIKFVNTGSSPINLTEIKARYYYTIDGEKPQNFWCDYSGGTPAGTYIGLTGNVAGSIHKLNAPKNGADYYIEVGFNGSAGIIASGGDVEVHARVAKNDWSNYRQANDFSFNSGSYNHIDWVKVPATISGIVSWGIGPTE